MRLSLLLAAALLWCAALVGYRVHATDRVTYVFLSWNLVLAAIPYVAAVAIGWADRRGVKARWLVLPMALWLLFLPNAPYVLTDLLHLRTKPPVPLWYDLVLLLSCAGTALALGYASLLEVHDVLTRRIGPNVAWALAVASLFLSSFGIYLGRFLRWNSWEVLTRPTTMAVEVFDRFANPLSHPRTWGVTLLLGVSLTLGYALLHALRPASAR